MKSTVFILEPGGGGVTTASEEFFFAAASVVLVVVEASGRGIDFSMHASAPSVILVFLLGILVLLRGGCRERREERGL
jgi:hypothetical protein